MEQYIVIAKPVPGATEKYEEHRILRFDPAAPAGGLPEGHVKVFGPAGLPECVDVLKVAITSDHGVPAISWFRLTVAQYALIGVVTLTFVAVTGYGAYRLYGSSPANALESALNADDGARVLITFLVVVTTVAIAFLATLTAMVIREYKERFALAKEVLTLLVGILGTIVGFYFGTAKSTAPAGPGNANTAVAVAPITPGDANASPDR